MGKIIYIKLNDPQPLDCLNCGIKGGYQYSDLFRMSYTSFHDPDGTYNGGQYNDGVLLNKGITVYCCNCGERLPFRLKREDIEFL